MCSQMQPQLLTLFPMSSPTSIVQSWRLFSAPTQTPIVRFSSQLNHWSPKQHHYCIVTLNQKISGITLLLFILTVWIICDYLKMMMGQKCCSVLLFTDDWELLRKIISGELCPFLWAHFIKTAIVIILNTPIYQFIRETFENYLKILWNKYIQKRIDGLFSFSIRYLRKYLKMNSRWYGVHKSAQLKG